MIIIFFKKNRIKYLIFFFIEYVIKCKRNFRVKVISIRISLGRYYINWDYLNLEIIIFFFLIIVDFII